MKDFKSPQPLFKKRGSLKLPLPRRGLGGFALPILYSYLLLMLVLAVTPSRTWSFSEFPIHHKLQIELEPSTRFAKIQDQIQFKTSKNNCHSFAFYLHSNLKLNHHEVPAGWQMTTTDYATKNLSLLRITISKSKSTTCPEKLSMTLNYSGILYDSESVDTTSFVFSGASFFYPQTIDDSSFVTFDMQVSLPEPWQVVSQGKRTDNEISGDRRNVTWKSSCPSQEIYLIGNSFHVYEVKHNGRSLYAYLLQKEDALADRYLQTAKSYIDFYSKLIGPYPYEKFALVENSRQTGYGMPSFTLMGSRIIRFPFILHSSYPHEILHNWWGNGVFADMKQGNWSEGLTAYLADHLLLEVKGKGPQYRFQEMMKFSNYVNEENDFPLRDFSYRESMASQAIGYAKLLMVFHMLRTEVGDDNFLISLKKFYASFKYRYAGYEELRRIFEEVSGQNLADFFDQWIQRKGAPEISVKKASYLTIKGRYDLSLTIEQKTPAFKLKLPVAIWTTSSETAQIHHVELETNEQEFHFQLSAEPVAVQVDPYNDVFRLPGDGEAPASLAQTYGAQRVTALLPVNGNQNYQPFAQAVTKPDRILTSDSVPSLPEGSLWVFGRNHPLSKSFIAQIKKSGIEVKKEGIQIQGQFYPWEDHSFVFTVYRTDQKKGTMTWVITHNKDSIPGLIRKLPHYGKYGYLVFNGTAPDNQNKGIWPSNPEDLQKVFRDGHQRYLPEQKKLVQFRPFHKK
jgi:aminopeptidase N